MISKNHFMFGYQGPSLTTHFLDRYAERIFNVPEKYSHSWSIANRKKLLDDFYNRLKSTTLADVGGKHLEYLQKKYGTDIRFLKQNNIIFVVRGFRTLVTCFNIKCQGNENWNILLT